MKNYNKLKEKQEKELEKKFKNRKYIPKLCQNRNGLNYCGSCEQAWEYCSCSARNRGIKDAEYVCKELIYKVRQETIEYEQKRIKKEFIKWFNSKEIAEDIEDAINRILT